MRALKKIIPRNLFNCQKEKLQWVVNGCSPSNTNQMGQLRGIKRVWLLKVSLRHTR